MPGRIPIGVSTVSCISNQVFLDGGAAWLHIPRPRLRYWAGFAYDRFRTPIYFIQQSHGVFF